MDEQMDPQVLMERVTEVAKELRKSDVYPALIGGIAGGIAGALMATLIASRLASRGAPAESSSAAAKESGGPSWTVREVVQLVSVIAGLGKLVQEWRKERPKV